MTPEARTERWFRRHEPDYPPDIWRGTFRYAFVRAEVLLRDSARAANLRGWTRRLSRWPR